MKWPKEGTLLNGRFIIPKTTAYLKTEKESTLSDIMEPHPDEAFYLSDEKVKQLYKQAGNAVTVNVVKEIGAHIMNTNSLLH